MLAQRKPMRHFPHQPCEVVVSLGWELELVKDDDTERQYGVRERERAYELSREENFQPNLWADAT